LQELSEVGLNQAARLSECLESGLGFMGESARRSTLWHLQKNFGIKSEDFADHPDKLMEGLRRIFGRGTPLIERRLIAKVCSDFKINAIDVKDLKMAVNKARRTK